MVIKAVGAAATKNSLIASAFATDPERIRVLIDALWTRGPRGVVARSTMMTLGSRSKLVQGCGQGSGGACGNGLQMRREARSWQGLGDVGCSRGSAPPGMEARTGQFTAWEWEVAP